jgi:signal transduction histidine kinase
MVLLVIVLVGCTTLAMGVLAYRRARYALEEAANARLALLARDIARDLHRELADRVADITTWARLENMVSLTFGDVDKELAEFLRHSGEGREVYVSIVAFDRDGRAIATAGGTTERVVPRDLPAATAIRIAAGDAGAVLEVATPVFNPQRPGDRIGSLVAGLSPDLLLDGVTAGRTQEGRVTATLHTATGVLAETRPGLGPPPGPGFEKTAAVQPLPDIDGPALTIRVRQPARIALASILSLRDTLAQVAIVVLVLSAIAGGVMAWRVSVPIRRLTASVEAITSGGRPEPPLDLPGGAGEVGVLASAFEAMMARLAATHAEAVARSRLALLGEVAASLAHDVRTPLSVMKTSAQLLASGEISGQEQRDLARMVAAEVDRLNKVVTDLVDLARPREARRSMQSLGELTERAAAVLRPWARARGVAIETGTSRPGLRVLADGDQMQQVLLNLMHNAVQATSYPGVVGVRWFADGSWVVLEVSDSGAGFDREALARAFSPFFTTRVDGTGLGLAIVKRIVEEHGGDVGARNLDGGGACVWCRLPLRDEVA